MPRLFWKVFLSHWLALLLFSGGILIAAASYIDHIRDLHDEAHNSLGFKERAQAARSITAKEGLPGLTTWAEAVDGEELLPILVLDSKGHDLLGRSVSGVALAHLHRHQALMRANQFDDQHYHAVTLADGTEYWLVPDTVGVTLMRLITKPKVIMVPLVLATLVGALVGLLLAYSLAAPIRRLRRATRAYASGDLSYRVTPDLGGRRDEISDLAKAMDRMAESLNAILESKRALLRDVSHELRSPLARVQAALGLARRNCTSGGHELDHIQHETDRLNDLIGAILTFSRLDSGLQPLQQEALELGMLLDEAVTSTRLECDPRHIQIEVKQSTRGAFTGDPMLLYSAMENILRNAARYAPEDSCISVALSEVKASTVAPGEYLIQIRDAGPGVPEHLLDEIFNPFMRVGDDHTEGLGLGLAIAQRIIHAYRGRISAENHPEGGLLVSIHLPKTST
jgi:two-component system OmpR family sensor kinase